MLSIKSTSRARISIKDLRRTESTKKLIQIYDPFTVASRQPLRKRYKRRGIRPMPKLTDTAKPGSLVDLHVPSGAPSENRHTSTNIYVTDEGRSVNTRYEAPSTGIV